MHDSKGSIPPRRLFGTEVELDFDKQLTHEVEGALTCSLDELLEHHPERLDRERIEDFGTTVLEDAEAGSSRPDRRISSSQVSSSCSKASADVDSRPAIC